MIWLSWKKAILALLLVLLITVLSLFYSTQLLRWVVSVALPADQSIQLQELNGSLADGLQLKGVAVSLPGVQLTIGELQTRLDWRCLGRLELCVPELAVTQLSVVLPESSAPSEPDAEPASALNLPAVRLDTVTLKEFELHQGELSVRLASLQTGVLLKGDQVRIRPARLSQLQLHLPVTPDAPTTPSAPWWQYQAPALTTLPIPLRLELGLLELDQLNLSGSTELELTQLRLQLDAGPQAVVLHQLSTHYGQLVLQAKAQLQNQLPFALQGHFSLVTPEQQLDTKLSGTLQQLELTAVASGQQQAELNASLGLLQPKLPLKAQLQIKQLQWPLQGEAQYQLTDSQLSAEGVLDQLELAIKAQGRTPQTGETQLALDAAFQAPLFNWAALTLHSEQGQLQSQGQLDLEKLILQSSLDATNIRLDPWLPDYPGNLNAKVELSASAQAEHWSVVLRTLQASGSIRQQPLHLEGSLAMEGKGAAVSKFETAGLELRHGGNALTASGQLTKEWQLQLQLNAADLAQSLAGSKGSLSGEISVTGPQRTPVLALNLSGKQLRYQRDYRLEQFQLTGTLNSDKWQHQLELHLGKGLLAGQKLNSAELLLDGTSDQSQAVLQLDAEQLQAQLQLQAKAQKQQQWQLRLTQAQLLTPAGPWTLAQAATANVDAQAQRVKLSALCWQSEPAELCLKASDWLSATQGALELQLSQFQLAQLQQVLADEQRLSGEVALNASAQWKANQPLQAKLELTGSEGQWQQTQVSPITLPWQQWRVSAALAKNKLNSTAAIQFTDTASIQASLNLPDLTQQDKTLDAELALNQLNLSLLRSLLPEQTEFAALLNGQVKVTGASSKPMLAGQISLSDVKMHGVHAPMDIDQAQLQLDFRQQNAQLTGHLQSGAGKAELSGYADWFDMSNYQARLALTGQQLPVNLTQGQLLVSPELTVLLQNQTIAAQGTVTIPEANLAIDDLPPSAVQVSADEVILNKDLEIRRAAEQSTLKLSSDIRLVFGEQVKLQAFGLKSRLKGQLLFAQRGANQSLKGEMNLVDGTFRSYGQDLQIRKGKLIFNGPIDQPYLNIEAIRNPDNTEDDVIAGIRVTGPADQASATIFSQPGKPQANALSYLLTGRDLDSGSGGGNPLASSLIGMGIANSSGLVSSVGEALGFEQVTLDTTGSGDNSQVTVSGYLSPKLQLKYGVGIFNSLGEFTLRYELMKSLYLEAVRGLDNAVDLLYKFEFD